MSNGLREELLIKHTPYRVLGWMLITFCVFCAIGSWRAGARGVALGFLLVSLVGVFIVFSSGSMHVDSDSIKYYLPLASYQIRWNEVRFIEIDAQGGNMVFVGENKRLAVNGPMSWSGKDKRQMRDLIMAQIEKYEIQVRLTSKAMFRLSKNTRVGN